MGGHPLVTARRDLINRAYVKDLQPPKVQQGSGSSGTDPSKVLPSFKGKQLAAPVGISPLLKRVSRELSAITGVDVVPVEDFPVSPDVQRPRTRSTSKIVPPAQSVIDSFWVPERGTIRPQVPQDGFDLTKPPFTIDGKTLQPVLERCDQASTTQSPTAAQLGFGSLVPTQEDILEEHQATSSQPHETEQAAPSRAKAKGKALRSETAAEPPTEIGSDNDSDEVIICKILNNVTPKKVKVKKEKKPKKSAKVRKEKAPRTPLALRKPPLGDLHDDLQLDNLFGSMSEDEDNLLSSPKANLHGQSTDPGTYRGRPDGSKSHKSFFVLPQVLRTAEPPIPFHCIKQEEGQYVTTFSGVFHMVVNIGSNCTEAINVCLPEWEDYANLPECKCQEVVSVDQQQHTQPPASRQHLAVIFKLRDYA
ncbi:hypothetical protein DAPPUDRAFT_264648 [Daphnia pulex]|uniref:JmjC domain-containing protein n=1 Tax=Daphnia pulex TaxID=6669 RepID=E9HS15_DAPPU|nr:hypothetical protein DAPPUDRAFT_264648 [Daphnia pulex]|eukprot:EFX65487.1 hypothetical protein DAPPUDRAFT_264648 [Daphnia pulex]